MLKKLMLKSVGFAQNNRSKGEANTQRPEETHPLSTKLEDNKSELLKIFDHCSDIAYRDFIIDTSKPINAFLVYAQTLVDSKAGSESILRAVMTLAPDLTDQRLNIVEIVNKKLLAVMGTITTNDLLELVTQVLHGGTAIVIDGSPTAIICMVDGRPKRAIDEPMSEPVVRGSREGFIEDYKSNLALIRKRICSSRLKVEAFRLGEISKTTVGVLYIKGIVNDKLVEEVRQRINRIKIDVVIGSNMIEELIHDEPFSLFPLVQWTERPDKTAAGLAEGRIAIILDNAPIALLVPAPFITMLQAAEDYYNESAFATFVRLLRFLAINIALMLPALVVAVISFHQELLPDKLFYTIVTARQGLPFPIFVEVFIMEITFELLREAGVRLPRTIGQAVSIVGGLVIGQAAVNAGFVGPLAVVTVSFTAIASFAIPNYSAGTAIRILRFFLIFLAAILGGIGIAMGIMFILYYLAGLRSFGVPYLSPFAPWSPGDWKDTIVRVPWWSLITRPRLWGAKDPAREDLGQGPQKPNERESQQ